MWLRRLELLGGVLGGILGLTALSYALFAPLGKECIGSSVPGRPSTCHATSLLQAQGLASLSFTIVLFGGLSLGLALGAVGHSLRRHAMLLTLLWVCTMLLLAASLLALLSIGVFFMPAAILALLTSIVGTLAGQQRQGHGQRLPTGA
jgi:hypothetical protein